MTTGAITLDGHDVISLRLALPCQGVGTLEAELDLDASEAWPTGTVLLAFAAEPEPIAYVVTILDVLSSDTGREVEGRVHVFAVQGWGTLRASVEGQDYGSPVAPVLIAEDILEPRRDELREERDLSALVTLPLLRRWTRASGSRHRQLDRLVAVLSETRPLDPIVWRMARDGSVVVAPEAWPVHVSSAPDDSERWVREPDADGLGELALDAPTLAPGMTVARPPTPNGTARPPVRIAEVIYEADEDKALRTIVRVRRATPPATSHAAFVASVRSAVPPLGLSVPWWARVVAQDDDGALGLVLDVPAAREGSPAPPVLSLSGVPYVPGLPAWSLRVPLGARCLVEWVGGREDAPVVRSWLAGQLGPVRLTLDARRGQLLVEAAGLVGLQAVGKVTVRAASIELNDRMLGTGAKPV